MVGTHAAQTSPFQPPVRANEQWFPTRRLDISTGKKNQQQQKTDFTRSSPSGRIVWESVSQSARYCMSVFIFRSEVIGILQLCLPHRSLNYTFLFFSLATDPFAPVLSPHLFDPCHHLCVCRCSSVSRPLTDTRPAGIVNRFVHTVESKEISTCRSADLSVLYGSLVPLTMFSSYFLGFSHLTGIWCL